MIQIGWLTKTLRTTDLHLSKLWCNAYQLGGEGARFRKWAKTNLFQHIYEILPHIEERFQNLGIFLQFFFFPIHKNCDRWSLKEVWPQHESPFTCIHLTHSMPLNLLCHLSLKYSNSVFSFTGRGPLTYTHGIHSNFLNLSSIHLPCSSSDQTT